MSSVIASYHVNFHQYSFSEKKLQQIQTSLDKISHLQKAFLAISLEKHFPLPWYNFWTTHIAEDVLAKLNRSQYLKPKEANTLNPQEFSQLIQKIPLARNIEVLTIFEQLGEMNLGIFSPTEKTNLTDILIRRIMLSDLEEETFSGIYLLRRIRKDSGNGSIEGDHKLAAIFKDFVLYSHHYYSRHLAYEGLQDLGYNKRVRQLTTLFKTMVINIPPLVPVVSNFISIKMQQKQKKE